MRGLDLYSGVGGWSLGLAMAGVEVVQSYERWSAANETNAKNNGHAVTTVDIRTLDVTKLPKNIDFVVGSPPCTQFSLSNRGGSGDVADGLIDIIKFFEIVDYVRPKKWAMENVPSVAQVLEKESRCGGALYRFRHLNIAVRVFNIDEFGLPQRRRRCIAGNFDFDLLASYTRNLPPKTLGDIIHAYSGGPSVDPVYGLAVRPERLVDHEMEEFLNVEEERINRSAKISHPVYNAMQFPDPLSRPVRTVTATSTRVSRESIIIEDQSTPGRFRRLTIRESASAQGFPATFQFYGSSYGQKIRMVGNAVPPVFSFYIGQAMLGVKAEKLKTPSEGVARFKAPIELPTSGKLDRPGFVYPANRRFRFSVPNLRLKSGVRFELANNVSFADIEWDVSLHFGTSQAISTLKLHQKLLERIISRLPGEARELVRLELMGLSIDVGRFDAKRLQKAWLHQKGLEASHPFLLLDRIGASALNIQELLRHLPEVAIQAVRVAVASQFKKGKGQPQVVGVDKLVRHADLILSGILVGSIANMVLKRQPPAEKSKVRTAIGAAVLRIAA